MISAWWGVGALAAAAGVGAAIGAAANPDPCNTPQSSLLCGPKFAALEYGSMGVLLGGIAGLAAALSPKYRRAGLTAAGVTAGLFLVGTINAKMKAAPASQQVTP